MKISIQTQYSIGDKLYKLADNCIIKEYDILNVKITHVHKNNESYITYTVKRSNSGFSPIDILETDLNENGYFGDKKEIIKFITEQL